MDFQEHNEEVSRVWSSFERGDPERVPMTLGLNSRFFMFNPVTNPRGVTYREYSEDPDLMFEMQAQFDRYRRFHVAADWEMGLPATGWEVSIDFQNYYEASWLGAPVRYIEGDVPDSLPVLTNDRKNLLFDSGIPDPFSGIMGRGRGFFERFHERTRQYRLDGRPVSSINPAFTNTDGPFTVACNLRGATELCVDLYEDPEYVRTLLDFVTRAAIERISAWRKYLDQPLLADGFSMADDSISLLSTELYREFVLPHHRRFYRAFSRGSGENSIHLCGDASRHFPIIKDELNVRVFDTGYPIDHGSLVRTLGPGVKVLGGPTVELLRTGSEREIVKETKRILSATMPHTKKFVLREANNVAPGTPLASLHTMYDTCRAYGAYRR